MAINQLGDDGRVTVHLATQNAAEMWTAVAHARGYALVRHAGYLLIDDSRLGLRCLVLSATPGDTTEVVDRIRGRTGGPILVEDPFGAVDLTPMGLNPRQLPVMMRPPTKRPGDRPGIDIVRVRAAAQLDTAERVIVDGFPLEAFAPHQPGEAFPAQMLDCDGVDFFVAERDGVPVGACLTVDDGDVCGFYWVTTLAEHRSTGVGRALMYGALAQLPPRPVTLTASRAGRPLYESMGFDTLALSTWWS